jgi:hypothetical protein
MRLPCCLEPRPGGGEAASVSQGCITPRDLASSSMFTSTSIRSFFGRMDWPGRHGHAARVTHGDIGRPFGIRSKTFGHCWRSLISTTPSVRRTHLARPMIGKVVSLLVVMSRYPGWVALGVTDSKGAPVRDTQVRHRRRGHQESAAPGLPTAAAAPRTASVRLTPSRAENAPRSAVGGVAGRSSGRSY